MRLRFHIPRTGGWLFCLPGDPGRVEVSYSLGLAIDVLQSAAGRVSRLMCPTRTFTESFCHSWQSSMASSLTRDRRR